MAPRMSSRERKGYWSSISSGVVPFSSSATTRSNVRRVGPTRSVPLSSSRSGVKSISLQADSVDVVSILKLYSARRLDASGLLPLNLFRYVTLEYCRRPHSQGLRDEPRSASPHRRPLRPLVPAP